MMKLEHHTSVLHVLHWSELTEVCDLAVIGARSVLVHTGFNSLPGYYRCVTFTCCCTELSALRVVGPQAFGRDSLCHRCAEVMQIISWSKTKLCMHACTHRGFKDPPSAGFRSTYCMVQVRFSWTLNQHSATQTGWKASVNIFLFCPALWKCVAGVDAVRCKCWGTVWWVPNLSVVCVCDVKARMTNSNT